MKHTLLVISLILSSILLIRCKKDSDATPANTAPNYSDSVKRSLWGQYTFTNGSLADSSGNNHNMTAMNGIIAGADKTGNANSALAFDGINDFAVINDAVNLPEGDFTISFLMNTSRTNGRIFNKANYTDGKSPSINFGFDDDNNTSKLNFSISKDNNVCNNFWSPGSATTLYTNTVIFPNNWYHIAAQHINGVERVYINGQLIAAIATPNISFKACPNAPLYFGIWWLGGMLPYKGTLDNIRVYTRAISGKEIKYLSDHSR